MSGMKGGLVEKDIYIDPFRGPGRVLWVCSTSAKASIMWTSLLGEPAGIRMGYPGMALMGMEFDRIILDDIYAELKNEPRGKSKVLRASIDAWIVDALSCRLSPGGELGMIVGVGK